MRIGPHPMFVAVRRPMTLGAGRDEAMVRPRAGAKPSAGISQAMTALNFDHEASDAAHVVDMLV